MCRPALDWALEVAACSDKVLQEAPQLPGCSNINSVFSLGMWPPAIGVAGTAHSLRSPLTPTDVCSHAVADPLKSFFATALLSWLTPAPQQLHVY